MSPLLALRAAVLARIAGDPILAALLGGEAAIHDEPPRGQPPVYALFGPAEARDRSTPEARAHEHALRIVLWGRPGSARGALEAAERIAALLDDASLPLQDHRLVLLRAASVEAGRDEKTGLARVVLALSALTEAV